MMLASLWSVFERMTQLNRLKVAELKALSGSMKTELAVAGHWWPPETGLHSRVCQRVSVWVLWWTCLWLCWSSQWLVARRANGVSLMIVHADDCVKRVVFQLVREACNRVGAGAH